MIRYYELDASIKDKEELWPVLIDCFGFELGRLLVGDPNVFDDHINRLSRPRQEILRELKFKMKACFGSPPDGSPRTYLTASPGHHTPREVDLNKRYSNRYGDHWEPVPVSQVPRQVEIIIEHVLPLLLAPCTTLFLIDPYIRTGNETSFMAVLGAIFDQLPSAPLREIQIHTRWRGDNEEKAIYDRLAPRLVNRGKLTVCRWRSAPAVGFHNRYLLSDYGGISFGWGFNLRGPDQRDTLIPFSGKVARQIMEIYDYRDHRVARYPLR